MSMVIFWALAARMAPMKKMVPPKSMERRRPNFLVTVEAKTEATRAAR